MPGIRDIYRRLEMPVLVIANEDGNVRFDALPGFSAEHHNWRIARIPNAKEPAAF